MPIPPSIAPPDGADRASTGAWLLGLLVAWTAINALGAIQSVAVMQSLGGPASARLLLAARTVDLALGALWLPPLLWLVRRPPGRGGWVAHAAVALLATAAFVAVCTVAAVPLERALLGSALPGSRMARGMGDFLSLALLAGGLYAVELRRRVSRRERQALRLEARLSEARLDALAGQLRPHFLFNTLNAISVLMHRDANAADLMLTRLSELLRATLQSPATHEIPLREEARLLTRYVEIMRVRHGPRLTVREAFPAELGDVLVPAFLLQPLVENALEHGIAARAGAGQVEIAARAEGGRLRLSVTDDGAGLVTGETAEGVGLSNTRRRLEELYGDACRLSLERAEGAGTRAVVELPLRRAAST